MASLKEIKGRINSVNGTLKITSAMKMVASSKLHKVQGLIGNMLPYERQMHEILFRLMSDTSVRMCEEYMTPRPVRKVSIVAVASNSSLCGAFNSNAIRNFTAAVDSWLEAGLSRDDITVYAVGRKMAEAVAKAGFPPTGDYNRLGDRHDYNEIASFAENLTGRYLDRETDRVELVYTHFKSTAVQVPVRETFLPFSRSILPEGMSEEGEKYLNDYIIEPDPESVLRVLLPKVLILKIFTMLVDANAAEHAARMMSMQEATDNGNQLLQELSLQYNKQRQQSITDELLDIVSGSMA